MDWFPYDNGLRLERVKACVRYFHQIFIFSSNYDPSKTQDIQIFVFLSFPLFLPVSHSFGG